MCGMAASILSRLRRFLFRLLPTPLCLLAHRFPPLLVASRCPMSFPPTSIEAFVTMSDGKSSPVVDIGPMSASRGFASSLNCELLTRTYPVNPLGKNGSQIKLAMRTANFIFICGSHFCTAEPTGVPGVLNIAAIVLVAL